MNETDPPGAPSSGRIGLVLGAGGGAGGMWIRGVLDGLAETTGFRPEHADVLIGTSIGAIAASGIGPFTPPPPSVVDALRLTQAPLAHPSPISLGFAAVRRLGGKATALISREGEPDPLTWVEHIESTTRAQVCSVGDQRRSRFARHARRPRGHRSTGDVGRWHDCFGPWPPPVGR